MSGISDAARAIRGMSERSTKYWARSPVKGTVTKLAPLTLQMHEGNVEYVVGEELVLGQWVRRYHRSHGVEVGDVIKCSPLSNGEFLAEEVVSRKRVDHDRVVPRSEVNPIGQPWQTPYEPADIEGPGVA